MPEFDGLSLDGALKACQPRRRLGSDTFDSPMRFNSQNANFLADRAQSILGSHQPKELQIHELWVTMAHLQAMILAQKLRNTIGDKVCEGPFKGMQLTPDAMTMIFGPYLAGTYEKELHPFLEQIIATPYQNILNIGCAFGYYATGLALRMPHVAVHAFDINEAEQKRCRDMAALNNVSDRVTVAGLFQGEDFATYANTKTLVLMDIEGGETTLLDPIRFPALQKMDIVVELHDVLSPDISKAVIERFTSTHDIAFISNQPKLFDFTPFVGTNYVDPFDSLILVWENRDGPTPWAVMRTKSS